MLFRSGLLMDRRAPALCGTYRGGSTAAARHRRNRTSRRHQNREVRCGIARNGLLHRAGTGCETASGRLRRRTRRPAAPAPGRKRDTRGRGKSHAAAGRKRGNHRGGKGKKRRKKLLGLSGDLSSRLRLAGYSRRPTSRQDFHCTRVAEAWGNRLREDVARLMPEQRFDIPATAQYP